MATKFCKWPPENKAAADAYVAACNVAFRVITGEADGIWYISKADANGNWTVAMLAPPWEYIIGVPFTEPPACALAREGAVVVDTPEWPVIDE